jgi:hypothetical protein
MGALLASTSLHLASEANNAAAAQSLVTASLQHQNRAIAGLKQNLLTLSPKNCDDVFLTTVLMMMCAFVSSIMPLRQDTQPRSTIDMLIVAFNFLVGAQAVGIRCFPWLFQGRAMELFGTGHVETEKRPRLDPTAAVANLRALNNYVSPQDSKARLDDIITKLQQGFASEIEEIPWLMSAGSEYIDLLRRNDLTALAVLMHYGVLLARVEGVWWARLAGKKVVEEISARLEGRDDQCAAMVMWSREHVGLQTHTTAARLRQEFG